MDSKTRHTREACPRPGGGAGIQYCNDAKGFWIALTLHYVPRLRGNDRSAETDSNLVVLRAPPARE